MKQVQAYAEGFVVFVMQPFGFRFPVGSDRPSDPGRRAVFRACAPYAWGDVVLHPDIVGDYPFHHGEQSFFRENRRLWQGHSALVTEVKIETVLYRVDDPAVDQGYSWPAGRRIGFPQVDTEFCDVRGTVGIDFVSNRGGSAALEVDRIEVEGNGIDQGASDQAVE